ncbi:unnamed protein product [Oncorhynchus mykiss]|uniref:CUB domain-containing protein n=1 Tax=Oncorhynchus mykiss TaxID=8022 RepID=A0A060WDR3_ONCMY|nr:unnamed protein product [Oncorhynchus mykiss]
MTDIFGLSSTHSVHNFSDDRHGNEGNAFFALRSCHQVMRGKSGEFFSPDYLCSNPPLWCNWTIQSDACSGKLDQIHLDEPLGVVGGHRILEKCWREAKYTSLSNILHVVQLIRGKPSPPHRGFYGRYEAFVPPVTDATQTHTAHLGSDPSTHQPPVLNPKSSLRTPSAMRRNVDAQTTDTIPPIEFNIVSHTTAVDDQGEESGNKELLKLTLGKSTASSDTQTPTDTQDPFNHLPNMVEQFFDSRHYEKDRNHTEVPHLPEDYLFEVAVEVNFLVAPEENWDHLVRSLLISVKSLVSSHVQ